MKLLITKGNTNESIDIFVQDSSKTDGSGLTGLVYNSSGLVCYYHRPGAVAAQLTLATQTVTGAHSDGGFVEISSANMPGWYRLDLSDAILASGVDRVGVALKGASNMAPVNIEIQLTNLNVNDGVRAGLTSLPNAAAEAAGGLYTRGSGAGQIAQDANGRIDVNLEAIDGSAQSMTDLKDFADEGYDPATNKVEGVKLVDTTTANSDMRGTDNALLAASAPTNWSSLSINGNGRVGIDLDNTEGTLAKTTDITGFNDLSSGDVQSACDAAITAAEPVDANLTQIDGDSVNGNVATLTLKQLDIQNSSGDALIAKSTGGNGQGLDIAGHGTGEGMSVEGGASGFGIKVRGGSTSGNAIDIEAPTSGNAIRAQGASAGHGLALVGGVTGYGIDAKGGNTSGVGARFYAQGGNGAGISAIGNGSGAGMQLTGGGSGGKDIDADEIDTIDTNVDSIKSTVDTNLDTTVSSRGTADPGDEMNLADDAITSAKYDETTAYPVESVDSGATQIARTGADADTLETISDQIDGLNDLSSGDVQTACEAAITAQEPIDANLIQIDGQATNGYNADLKLKSLQIRNSAGSALVAESQGSNGHGIQAVGQGSGSGIYAGTLAGGTGNGILANGGPSGGDGILAQANGGNGNGMSLVKDGTGKDIDADEIDIIDTNVDSIKSTVDTNLDTTVSSRGTADPGDEMNLADDAITSAKYDETTAYPVESADSGATQIARTGADADTLETISDQIDGLNDLSSGDVQTACEAAITAQEPIDANLIQIDGQATNGYNADLKLKSVDIQNDAGVGLTVKGVAPSGTHGAEFVGYNTNSGIYARSTLSGFGVDLKGGANGGSGIRSRAVAGNSPGAQAVGNGTGAGYWAQGGSNGPGVSFNGQGESQNIDAAEISQASGIADAGSSTTQVVDSARTEADTNYWKDSWLLMLSGDAAGQVRRITAFDPGTDTITVDSAFTQSVDAGDRYAILPAADVEASIVGAVNVTQWGGNAVTGDGDWSLLQSDVTAIKAKTDTLPSTIRKNTAIDNFKFVMRNATTGEPLPGLTVTAERSLDDSAFTAMANSVVQRSDGVYEIDVDAADTNCDSGAWKFTATGAKPTIFSFLTES